MEVKGEDEMNEHLKALEFYRTCLTALSTVGIDKLVVTMEDGEMEVNVLEDESWRKNDKRHS